MSVSNLRRSKPDDAARMATTRMKGTANRRSMRRMKRGSPAAARSIAGGKSTGQVFAHHLVLLKSSRDSVLHESVFLALEVGGFYTVESLEVAGKHFRRGETQIDRHFLDLRALAE